MNIAKSLGPQVQSWGSLAIVIVIVSIILLKFQAVSGMTTALNATINTFVAALAEPANWVSIAIIALIGFAILKYFSGKRS
jgi:hypothetical protein